MEKGDLKDIFFRRLSLHFDDLTRFVDEFFSGTTITVIHTAACNKSVGCCSLEGMGDYRWPRTRFYFAAGRWSSRIDNGWNKYTMIITYGLIISSPDFPHLAFTARVSCDDLHDTSTPSNFAILIMAGRIRDCNSISIFLEPRWSLYISRDSLSFFFFFGNDFSFET